MQDTEGDVGDLLGDVSELFAISQQLLLNIMSTSEQLL